MGERLTDEHLRLLERAHNNIESEYTPRCQSAPYGNGCPGATGESIEFWRRAADAVPAMLAELRVRRAANLTDEDREALAFARKVVGASGTLFNDRTADPKIREHVERCSRALSVLDRLLGAKP